MKRNTNFQDFKSILPYSSEIFGVYQPLLGWKSTRIEARIRNGFMADKSIRARELFRNAYSKYEEIYEADIYRVDEIISIGIGHKKQTPRRFDTEILNELSFLLTYGEIGQHIGFNPDSIMPEEAFPHEIWSHVITSNYLTETLNTSVVEKIRLWAIELQQELNRPDLENSGEIFSAA
mgnify:CR=1 FL=1